MLFSVNNKVAGLPEKVTALKLLLIETFARSEFFARARKKLLGKRNLHTVNEHFEAILDAAMAKKSLREKVSN